MVIGNRVLVQGDINLITAVLQFLARHLHAAQVNQHQMVVRAVRKELESLIFKGLGKSLCIGCHLVLVCLEFRL